MKFILNSLISFLVCLLFKKVFTNQTKLSHFRYHGVSCLLSSCCQKGRGSPQNSLLFIPVLPCSNYLKKINLIEYYISSVFTHFFLSEKWEVILLNKSLHYKPCINKNISILDVNLFSFLVLWEKLTKEGILHLYI